MDWRREKIFLVLIDSRVSYCYLSILHLVAHLPAPKSSPLFVLHRQFVDILTLKQPPTPLGNISNHPSDLAEAPALLAPSTPRPLAFSTYSSDTVLPNLALNPPAKTRIDSPVKPRQSYIVIKAGTLHHGPWPLGQAPDLHAKIVAADQKVWPSSYPEGSEEWQEGRQKGGRVFEVS